MMAKAGGKRGTSGSEETRAALVAGAVAALREKGFAGASARGGITYGESDKDAAYPISHPVSPADLAILMVYLEKLHASRKTTPA